MEWGGLSVKRGLVRGEGIWMRSKVVAGEGWGGVGGPGVVGEGGRGKAKKRV